MFENTLKSPPPHPTPARKKRTKVIEYKSGYPLFFCTYQSNLEWFSLQEERFYQLDGAQPAAIGIVHSFPKFVRHGGWVHSSTWKDTMKKLSNQVVCDLGAPPLFVTLPKAHLTPMQTELLQVRSVQPHPPSSAFASSVLLFPQTRPLLC